MGWIREPGKLERECLVVIHYLLKTPYNLSVMGRDLGWTKERVLNYVHPNRWKTITFKQLQNWRDFHWKGRSASYRYSRSLYMFVLKTLRKRPDGKWEYNRSKLPILRHYAQKYGYGIAAHEMVDGLKVEVYKVCDLTEKYLLAYTAEDYLSGVPESDLEDIYAEADKGYDSLISIKTERSNSRRGG